MELTIINPAELGAPKGYSHGVLARGGALLFVAGQVGWTAEQVLVSGDFVEQFGQALSNVQAVVKAAGGGADSIARLTIYVTDLPEYRARLKEVGAAYRGVMGRHFPAMTLVEVKSLLDTGAKVEIEATAII